MKYEILTYGRPELREEAVPVPEVNAEIRQLAKDMLAAMYAREGIGLAAQQVGRTEALCVIDIPPLRDEESKEPVDPGVAMPLVMINPEITNSAGRETCREGCLSFPEIFVPIARAAEIDVSYQDLKGRKQTLHAAGLLARAVQHELDHLRGVLLVDRMSPVQKVALAGRLKKLKKQAS